MLAMLHMLILAGPRITCINVSSGILFGN